MESLEHGGESSKVALNEVPQRRVGSALKRAAWTREAGLFCLRANFKRYFQTRTEESPGLRESLNTGVLLKQADICLQLFSPFLFLQCLEELAQPQQASCKDSAGSERCVSLGELGPFLPAATLKP